MNTTTEIRNLDDYKAACMEKPRNYMEWAERGFAAGWGMTHVSRHRESGVLDESNFNAQVDDLCERFPDSFYVQSTSSDMVGWVEHLRVNMADDDAVEAAYEWYCHMEDNLVADESDWERREEEAFEQAWDNYGYREFQDWAIDNEIDVVTELDEDGMRVFLDMPSIKDAALHALACSGSGDHVRMDTSDTGVVFDHENWVASDYIIKLRRRIDRLRAVLAHGGYRQLVQQCLVCPCATAAEIEHFFSPRYEVARYIDCPVHGRVTVYLAKEV